MSLSTKAKRKIQLAVRDEKTIGDEVIARVDRQSATVEAIETADGSDPATTQALANANKAKINEIIAALKAANLMA
jgi:hypothetical protein